MSELEMVFKDVFDCMSKTDSLRKNLDKLENLCLNMTETNVRLDF